MAFYSMSTYSREDLILQKNIYGLIFLLYSVTYIGAHATAIFSLEGMPKEILHYSGEVVLILCAVGYEVFGMMSKKGGTRKSDLFHRIPILFWIGCGAVFLNAVLLIVSVLTGRCEK
jgi:membrane protease YdiL (CAAX protease family)